MITPLNTQSAMEDTSSNNLSETSTFLPSPSEDGPHDSRTDIPIHLDAFTRAVWWGRLFIGLALPLSAATDVLYFLHGASGTLDLISAITAASTSVTVLLCFLYTLAQPITIDPPCRSTDAIAHLELHARFCLYSFIALVIACVARCVPWITYVYLHHHGPSHSSYEWARHAAALAALAGIGSTRRGPLLRYNTPKLSQGFGISGEMYNEVENELESNVLDWQGCSMLGFVTLSYNAQIARRSIRKDQLQTRDLLFLEEKVRMTRFCSEVDDADQLGSAEATEWKVFKAIFWSRRWVILQCFCIETCGLLFGFLQLYAMYELINTFNDPPGSDKSYSYLACACLFIGQVMQTVLTSVVSAKECYQLTQPNLMTFVYLIFSKILRAQDAKGSNVPSSAGTGNEGNGRIQVLNLLNGDAFFISVASKRLWEFTNALINLIIGGVLLYHLLGISGAAGVATIPVAGPLAYLLSRRIYHCDKVWARCRDARVSAIKEFLDSIKVVKLNAWEPYFVRRIERLRDNELVWQRWRYHLGTMVNILSTQAPVIAMLAMFACHTVVMGRKLDAATGLMAFKVLERIQMGFDRLPSAIQDVLATRVALQRVVGYLNLPETIHLTQAVSDTIEFQDATIAWPMTDTRQGFRLHLDFKFSKGFTLICGPLGSGKSLLLRALLGEAVVEDGKVRAPRSHPNDVPLDDRSVERAWTKQSWINESVAYAPQHSYIRHATIRNNILFGQPFWRERYWEVIRQCGLLPDLGLLADGDMTEVGEGGVTLSGGQKARINLARCVYSRARTVLLDDVLSAVDAHTAQHIFTECLTGPLFAERTLLLVTHQVGLCIAGADHYVSLRHGRLERACSPKEVRLADIEYDLPKVESDTVHIEARQGSSKSSREAYPAEKRRVGRVSADHYKLVTSAAGGNVYWIILAFLIIGPRFIAILRRSYLRDWTAQPDNDNLNFYLGAYCAVSAITAILDSSMWVWLYGIGPVGFYNRGCRRLHNMAIERIAGTPLGFFDSTPKGRLLNVLGADIQEIDTQSADNVGRGGIQFFGQVAALMVIFFYDYRIVLVAIFLLIPFHYANKILRKLRADIKRLMAICMSPTWSLYSDTLDGAVMIRAFGLNEVIKDTLVTLIDHHKKASVANWLCFLSATVVIQSLSAVTIAFTAFLLVGRNPTAAQAGFILSYAVEVSSGLFGLLERASDLENTFVHAERINHYVELREQESIKGDMPPEFWPEHGQVVIRNLTARYAADLPPVLHGISLDIEAGKRYGLVGATGSGKSTLALSLFRGLQQMEGTIQIDGLDINQLALPVLRARLNMIVQESTLCSGTLRDALDVTGEKDDYVIYEALQRVHLLDREMTGPFADLDSVVAPEGANFSQGERQLLCLARALLKTSKILVMDEATSSIDCETDAKITKTVDECFKGVTMLVIAHRLATIMQFDQVVVLDAGTVVEQGRPKDLIADDTSRFHSLCLAQGVEEFEQLRGLADL